MKVIDNGQLAISLGVGALGGLFFFGASWIPDAAGYSTVGPAVVPRLVGAALLLCAGFLAYEVARGGFRNHDEAAERALPTDWVAFAWVSAGLVLYGLLIERAGFVPASMALYLCVARGFDSRRWALNALVALALAIAIFATFTHGLGLNLPRGVLAGLL
jgi:putative tricarboxylic transport membrane protein